MANKKRPTHISKPTYPGGLKAMREFVEKHLQYPAEAKEQKVEGTVTVRYSLDYRGKVVGTKIKKGLGHGCDEEAERVVSLMRFVVPQDRKRKVHIHQDLSIHFKLPKEKKAGIQAKVSLPGPGKELRITYTTTPNTPDKGAGENTDQGKEGYGYSINW